jgi:UDP-N-acetyl-D-galactosamine dehydrogenase
MSANVCVVGLGYVGLPLAIEFDRVGHDVVGYDIDQSRIEQLQGGADPTDEVDEATIVNSTVEFTTDETAVERAGYVVVAVPTPVDELKNPDLNHVESAGEMIGRNLSAGTTVVLESTVFPGATREIFVPAIERTSGATAGDEFRVGYSPERVVPGDDTHDFRNVVKIVGAQGSQVVADLAEFYESVVDAGVYRAPSIEVAEAAKCVENIQRDLNIALINEMAMFCHSIGIDIHDVLAAAGTKWNFHDYRPGLVGGHCIPVDPFFVIYQSRRNGEIPNLVENGRKVNEHVPEFVGELTLRGLTDCGKRLRDSTVLVLGLSYKPNVGDIRTSAVKGVIENLDEFNVNVVGYEPHVEPRAVREEFGIGVQEELSFEGVDAALLATPHDKLVRVDYASVARSMAPEPLVIDVTGALDADRLRSTDRLTYRRL